MGTYSVAADEQVTCIAEEGQCFDGNGLVDPFDQVVQAFSKLSRSLVNCATLVVVSELFMITSSLASLREREREREEINVTSTQICT